MIRAEMLARMPVEELFERIVIDGMEAERDGNASVSNASAGPTADQSPEDIYRAMSHLRRKKPNA